MTHLRRAFATASLLLTAAAVAVALAAAPALGADRIDTVAGSGNGGFGGDGGFATNALLTAPSDIAPLPGGEAFLLADTSNQRIRRVDAAGVITTVAGAGPCCGTAEPFAGDGVAATDPSVRLNQPRGVTVAPDGGFAIADTLNHRIRHVSAAGTITTLAGTGLMGYSGDGDNALIARLNAPAGIAAAPDGTYLVADTGNNSIRQIYGPFIRTIAGTGAAGFAGDGAAAALAQLNAPTRVVPLAGGGYLIADTGNNRIRRVSASGVISTVAGSAAAAPFGGDGGPATQAALNQPEGVAVRDDGAIVIADTGNERVREVAADGVIRTIAGTGTLGFGGDGGLPTAAQLSHPRAVALGGGRLRIADSFNHRVRAITAIADEQPRQTPPRVDPDPDPDPPRQVPPGVSPPLLGRTTVAAPVSGAVLIRLPGTRRFVPLESVTGIPLGSEVDATRGRVALLFTTTPEGRTASAIVSEGRVVVRQPQRLDLGQRPGSLALSGPLTGCSALRRAGGAGRGGLRRRAAGRATPRPRAAAAKRKGKRGRRAKVHAEGRIEVRGRYGAAIVRGTRWTTIDRCPRDPRPGTLFAVGEGRVLVTAFVLRRRTLVTAGRRLLAPARRQGRTGRTP